MQLGSFWGITAPMLLLAYDDVNDALNAVEFVRKSVNSNAISDLHTELYFLLKSKDILVTTISSSGGKWFSELEPNAQIMDGVIADVSCSEDVAMIDLVNELSSKVAQKIIDGERKGKFVKLASPVRSTLDQVVKQFIQSETFSSNDINRVAGKIYRSLKSDQGYVISDELLNGFPHEETLPSSIIRNGIDIELTDSAEKIFWYFYNRLDDVQRLFDATVAAHEEEVKLFNLSISDFLQRDAGYFKYTTVRWFKYLTQAKHTAANLLDTVKDYERNLAILKDVIQKTTSSETIRVATDSCASDFEVSVYLDHPEDYSREELSAMNDVLTHVKSLTIDKIAEKIGIPSEDLENLLQKMCNYGIAGLNDCTDILFQDALNNVVIMDSSSYTKPRAYLDQMALDIADAEVLLRNIKPLGYTLGG